MSSSAPASTPPPGSFRTTHPKGLWVLFFAEMWERFSFYGMRALLVLYMTSQVLKYPEAKAYAIYGAYGTMVYAFPILGGYLADRFLGYGKAVILGGVLMALGHFIMAIENEWGMYLALGLICVGNGFFKPNISSTVGRLYAAGDPMRDRGFTIFYMGINIGALTAPLLCGWLGETAGWQYGFGAAGVGMILGLIAYVKGSPLLEGRADPPHPERLAAPGFLGLSTFRTIWVGAFLLAPIASALIYFHDVKDWILYATGVVMLWLIIRMMQKVDVVARHRILVFLILWTFHTGFWMLFEQAGSSLTIFARDNVDRLTHFGWLPNGEFPTSWFQSVNPLFIVLLAPIFTVLWGFLDRRQVSPSIPLKFGYGVVLLSLGYIVLVWGARSFATDGLTPFSFLVYMYILHTMGELCLSPVGLSAVTKLVPTESVGFFMGTWFLSFSFAHHFAGKIAGETATTGLSREESTRVFSDVYLQGGLILLGAGIFLMVISRLVNRLAHGVR